MTRNLSIDTYFNRLAEKHRPQFRFNGTTKSDWLKWRETLAPAVVHSLGRLPEKVPLRAEILAEWNEHGLLKQKIVFDVEEGLSANAYVFRPQSGNGKLPAILCCHGHGLGGKEPVMGNRSTPELAAHINERNYDYGLQMARAGYVTMAIDWRGFGERDDRIKPHHHDLTNGRDICNLHYLRASILGMTVLGMDVHDGKCAIDYLCQQDYVDASRIGVMGLSFGGTMATWLSICDERIKATNVMCWSDRFAIFGMRDVNFCGSQITPGLFAVCDVPDLHGLCAPRPLLVEIGIHDECFHVDSATTCFAEVEKIYSAAGARDNLELDLFEGGHRWGGRKSVEFFRKHL
jgi:dienelactone hydrolase